MAPGESVDVALAIPQAGRVEGRPTDAQGKPQVGARLEMQNHHLDTGEQVDGSWTRVMTDRDGRYAFVGVSPIGHVITVIDSEANDVFRTEVFGVASGQTVEQDLELPEGVALAK